MNRGAQLGHAVSDETRNRISASKLGKPCSSRTKFKFGRHPSVATEFKAGRVPHNVCDPGYSFIDRTTGYRMIRDPLRPGRWRREHTVVVEKAMGRRLECGEEAHHINGDKQDNRNENLLVCTTSYHRGLESRMAFLYQQEHFAGGT